MEKQEEGDIRHESSTKKNQNQTFIKHRLEIMYQCPPNQQDAEIHKAATTFGFNHPDKSRDKIAVCPCCSLPINTPIPFLASTTPITGKEGSNEIFLVQSGASLFFTFIKAVISYLVIFLVISSLFPIYMSSINVQYCNKSPQECGTSWFIKYSPVKFKNTIDIYSYQIMNLLNMLMIGVSIVFYVLYRKYLYEIYGILDLHDQTQDDYTILVKNLPVSMSQNQSNKSIKQSLKAFFQKKVKRFIEQAQDKHFIDINTEHIEFNKLIQNGRVHPNQLHIVKSISLCYDLRDFEQLMEQRDKLVQLNLKKAGKKVQTNGSTKLNEEVQTIPNQIADLNEKYNELSKSFLFDSSPSSQFTKDYFIGKALISFQFQHFRNYIIHLYQSDPQVFAINEQEFKVSQATNPQDIIWINLKIGKWQRIKNIIISYFVLLIVLVVVFVLITLIQVGQEDFGKQLDKQPSTLANQGMSYGYTLLIALLVYAVNYILGKVIKFLTDRERHESKTKYMISMVIKMFISQFLNTAGMYFLLSFNQGNHYLLNDGLVVQISNLMIISGLISIPLNFFQIDSVLYRCWRRFRYGVIDHDELFQFQYNQIVQLPQFDFADRYSYYLVQLFTLMAFSFINPICIPAIIIIFVFHYWIDKYNLFKCSSSTFPMNFTISRAILKILELSLLLFAAANYYFELTLSGQFAILNLIVLLIAAAYAFLAVISPAYIEDKIFGSEHELGPNSYSQCISLGKFKQMYWTCHPATMFIEEPDINKPTTNVNWRVGHSLATIEDLTASLQKAQIES